MSENVKPDGRPTKPRPHDRDYTESAALVELAVGFIEEDYEKRKKDPANFGRTVVEITWANGVIVGLRRNAEDTIRAGQARPEA